MLPGLRNKPLLSRLKLTDLSASLQSLINGALQRSGGTMTGDIVLAGDGTNALHPASKQQLDGAVSTINTALGLRMQYSLTAMQTASGLAVDFTGIPSWAKRVTVMFNELSTNGSTNPLIQIGSGSYKTTGYSGSQVLLTSGVAVASLSSGFPLGGGAAVAVRNGHFVIANMGDNIWSARGGSGFGDSAGIAECSGYVALTGPLTQLRIFFGGTDVADSGAVSILIEG